MRCMCLVKCCMRIEDPLGLTVFAIPVTPKVMHMLQYFAWSIHFAVVVADTAASVQKLPEMSCTVSC